MWKRKRANIYQYTRWNVQLHICYVRANIVIISLEIRLWPRHIMILTSVKSTNKSAPDLAIAWSDVSVPVRRWWSRQPRSSCPHQRSAARVRCATLTPPWRTFASPRLQPRVYSEIIRSKIMQRWSHQERRHTFAALPDASCRTWAIPSIEL